MQPSRQRACLEANPLHRHSGRPEERDQRFRLAHGTRLAHNHTSIIDDANGGLFQRHV